MIILLVQHNKITSRDRQYYRHLYDKRTVALGTTEGMLFNRRQLQIGAYSQISEDRTERNPNWASSATFTVVVVFDTRQESIHMPEPPFATSRLTQRRKTTGLIRHQTCVVLHTGLNCLHLSQLSRNNTSMGQQQKQGAI